MSDGAYNESVYLGDIVEDPVLIFRGEGSGEESLVGNEEKKKIFFFGQPGCLKNSPVKTSPENHTSKPVESTSTAEEGKLQNCETELKVSPSDEDANGDSLLRKISEVLRDEPDSTATSMSRFMIQFQSFY